MKKILLGLLCTLCLCGCGEKDNSTKEPEEVDPNLQAKQECCTDNGGYWNGNNCSATDLYYYYDEVGYQECLSNKGI